LIRRGAASVAVVGLRPLLLRLPQTLEVTGGSEHVHEDRGGLLLAHSHDVDDLFVDFAHHSRGGRRSATPHILLPFLCRLRHLPCLLLLLLHHPRHPIPDHGEHVLKPVLDHIREIGKFPQYRLALAHPVHDRLVEHIDGGLPLVVRRHAVGDFQ
jgi:hypothetical protein